jgi:hypothetical protein
MAKGPFEMHCALPFCRGLGVLTKVGGLSQLESDQFINDAPDVLRA